MSIYYFDPFFEALDTSGVSIAGATLTFYETNTTTPKNTFQDAAFTTPNTNPVVADGSGRFPEIYLQSGLYTILFKDSEDVLIKTIDDFNGAGSGTVNSVTATDPLEETGTADDPVIGASDKLRTAMSISLYRLFTTGT